MKTINKLWIFIIALVILAPLGLVLPEYFQAGSAWGEWSGSEIKKLVGYVPEGLAKLSSLWQAPMPDYTFKSWEQKGLLHQGFAYFMSAAAGIIVTVLIMLFIGKKLAKK